MLEIFEPICDKILNWNFKKVEIAYNCDKSCANNYVHIYTAVILFNTIRSH